MDEGEFNRLAEAMLAKIESALEDCGADLDVEIQAGGVIEVEFANGSKIVVNRHAAAREIWVAARSGGFHFKHDDGRWVSGREGAELMALLSRCVSEQSGTPVRL